ncbi:MAG: FIST N-terminal domain-containing protein [Candidatus Magasanikbacteria bacterium]
MKIEQKQWTKKDGWRNISEQVFKKVPQLVLIFGGREELEKKTIYDSVKKFYPKSRLIFCSTAGEILGNSVFDNTVVVTAIFFEKTKVTCAETAIKKAVDSEKVGKTLAKKLSPKGLVHMLIFSDGLLVNGTGLVKGLTSVLPGNVSVTGGLVADGAHFKKTNVSLDKRPSPGNIVIVGLYGSSLKVGYGSLGGWDTFGPKRKITKSSGNILFELDGKPALELYKKYLGEKAKDLPGSGLFFPLKIHHRKGKNAVDVVRTLLAVDEKKQSMTFAGDMPEGSSAELMKANFERLIDGAGGAASLGLKGLKKKQTELAILISCVGRKLVLGARTEEEVESVRSKVGKQAVTTGFYSYGEICPTSQIKKNCELHNQTMTITLLSEM